MSLKNNISEAYIRGVLDGDGWINWGNTTPRIGLDVTDRAFADRFFSVLQNMGLTPHINMRKRHYTNRKYPRFEQYDYTSLSYIVMATCKKEWIEHLKTLEFKTLVEKMAYLKGFYDSEGSYCECPSYRKHNGKIWKSGIRRSARFYNKDTRKLQFVKHILDELAIASKLYPTGCNVAFVEIHRTNDLTKLKHCLRRTEKQVLLTKPKEEEMLTA